MTSPKQNRWVPISFCGRGRQKILQKPAWKQAYQLPMEV